MHCQQGKLHQSERIVKTQKCTNWFRITTIALFGGGEADLHKHCHDDNSYNKEEELFEVPGAPQHPLLQAHHQHGLTNTGLLLKNQLLQLCIR